MGEFVWHSPRPTPTRCFLVVDGALDHPWAAATATSRRAGRSLFVVPRGVEHCPAAADEASLVLVEPTGVVNTGDACGDLTTMHDTTFLDDEPASTRTSSSAQPQLRADSGNGPRRPDAGAPRALQARPVPRIVAEPTTRVPS